MARPANLARPLPRPAPQFRHPHVSTAAPAHPETVYVNNLQLWRSTDGCVSFTEIATPHGDNHDLWIDPAQPPLMIQRNDC